VTSTAWIGRLILRRYAARERRASVQHQGCRLSGAGRVLRPGSTAICRATGSHAIQSRDLVKSPTPEWMVGDVFDDRQESSNGRNDLWPDFGLGSIHDAL